MHLIDAKPRRVIQEFFRDSTHWDTVKPRKDDIIIASCYKSGTTLTQQIINLLLNGNKEFESMRELSPWIDSGMYVPNPEAVEALPSRRFLKTHLPVEALPWHAEWKYIYLARDGRDVCLSLFNHCRALEEEFKAKGISVDNGPVDFSSFWDQWVETGKPRWEFWENIASWWQTRHLPNVLLLHFSDLIDHKAQEAGKIADFLDCEWNSSICDMVCKYSTVEYMQGLELKGRFGSPHRNKKKAEFVNKGTNGRWKDLLTDKQLAHYQKIISERLEPECADWLINGDHVD